MWGAHGDELEHGWLRTELCKSSEKKSTLAEPDPSVAACQQRVCLHQPASPLHLLLHPHEHGVVSLLLPALPQHQVDHVHSWHGGFEGFNKTKTGAMVIVNPMHCHYGQVLAQISMVVCNV